MTRRGSRRTKKNLERAHPVKIRIYDNLFTAQAEEMGAVLGRLGFSPNIKERRDYSTAIFDAHGNMVAQAAHIPVHLGSMPLSVKSAIDSLELSEGDIALLNDPFQGGTHLPDLTMVAPFFVRKKDKSPSFYVANRAHHADVGGMAGGSMASANEIYQEGLRIPPVHYVKAGCRDESLHQLLLANMRNPKEREGDLTAQIAAIKVGGERLTELIKMNGEREVLDYAQHLQEYSHRLVAKIISDIPDGVYSFKDSLDPDLGSKDAQPKIQVKISIKGSKAHIDFSGTSPQLTDNRNANPAITHSAVFYVFRCLGDEDLPSNAGCMKPIAVTIEPGSLLDAKFPSAVAAGNVETSQRIVDVLLGALSKAIPSRIPAASQGTMNNLTISGFDPFRNRQFTYYETLAGGTGASAASDGENAIHSHMTNTLNTPIESLETHYPFRLIGYKVRTGSGGEGAQRGGDGLIREIELLTPCEVAFIGERHHTSPYGLKGGENGKSGSIWIKQKGKKKRLPGRFHGHLPKGTVLCVETPGGGGYGKKRETLRSRRA